MKERRLYLRVNTKLPIRYQRKRDVFFALASAEDVSLGGAKLSVDRFLPAGLNLNLELNILSKIVKATARVAWIQSLPDSGQYRMGIEFFQLDPEEKNYLSDYINVRGSELAQMEK